MGLLREGQVIRDTYEVERLLGEGAFAEVYRVKHRFLGRQALKVFKTVGLTRDETVAMLGEALLLTRIGHPNIVRVFEANTVPLPRGTCGFFTMEYVPGGTLEHLRLSHGGRLMPVPAAVDLVRQVCAGLAVAHGQDPPIIHRDVKPQNILIIQEESGPRVRLSDFGLARAVSPLTLMAPAHGTLCFKAPEAFRGLGSDSCAGDVWAVGCTLYLLLTNLMPYPGPEGPDSLGRRRFERLVPPSHYNHEVTAELDKVAARALAPEPHDRYPDARAMLDDLTRRYSPAPAPASRAPGREAPAPELGDHPEQEARRMAAEAVRLALAEGKLSEAAALMEAACARWPALRERYEDQVKLWRRGIAM